MHKESQEMEGENNRMGGNWSKPRVLITSGSPDGSKDFASLSRGSGRLSGIYENYLLIRPYPSLRILFASPSLRVPGILQSPFMAKIGGSVRQILPLISYIFQELISRGILYRLLKRCVSVPRLLILLGMHMLIYP